MERAHLGGLPPCPPTGEPAGSSQPTAASEFPPPWAEAEMAIPTLAEGEQVNKGAKAAAAALYVNPPMSSQRISGIQPIGDRSHPAGSEKIATNCKIPIDHLITGPFHRPFTPSANYHTVLSLYCCPPTKSTNDETRPYFDSALTTKST